MSFRFRGLAANSRRSLLVAVPILVRVGCSAFSAGFRGFGGLPSVLSRCTSASPMSSGSEALTRRSVLGSQKILRPQARSVATFGEGALLSSSGLAFLGALKCAALAYGSILTVFFVLQRKLLFLPNPTIANPAATGGELIMLPQGQGAALFFEPKSKTQPIFVFFHGNADQLGWSPAYLGRRLSEFYGVGFLAIEYPGYGVLTGQGVPSEESITVSAEHVLGHVCEQRGLAQDRAVLFGHSVGCGPALEFARRGYGCSVVLVSPFMSIPEIASTHYPFLRPALRLLPFLVRDKFDNADKMPDIAMPILVIHGQNDQIVPADHGESLAKLNDRAHFQLVTDLGHNDIMDPDKVLSDIVAFAKASF